MTKRMNTTRLIALGTASRDTKGPGEIVAPDFNNGQYLEKPGLAAE